MPAKVKGMGWERYVALSPEAWLARRAEMSRLATARARKKKGVRARRAARQEDEARCYAWARVSPFVRVEADTGCWVWLGNYQVCFEAVEPRVSAGEHGQQNARRVVYELTYRKTLQVGCFLSPTCGRTECISPIHCVPTTMVQARHRARKRAAEQGDSP